MRRLAASQRQKVKVKGKDSRTEKEPSTTPEHDGQQRPRQGQFFSGAEASGLLTATELQSKLDAYRDTEASFEGNAPPECLAETTGPDQNLEPSTSNPKTSTLNPKP